MTAVPRARYEHLLSLGGAHGTFEHANHSRARVEHGYCTDDVARVLLVSSREIDQSSDLVGLTRKSLSFVAAALCDDGSIVNRRSADGRWHGPGTREDCWGRALWALGTLISHTTDERLRKEAMQLFDRAARVPSAWPRSMAFATFGAYEVLRFDPMHRSAVALVVSAAQVLDRPETLKGWHWPEDRLTYANAALPEALITAGTVLDDHRLIASGLRQLKWLLELSTPRGHLSVTPAQGRRPGPPGTSFDQQPIEVAAIAEACARAARLTGETYWKSVQTLATQWFMGNNDVGVVMFDPATGGGYDGLTARGPNLNQGAESTLCLLSTLQLAHHDAKVSQ